jgi:hypothetical protein
MPLEFDGVNGIIKNTTSDGDVTIKGNDGGSEISALTFDMSAEGVATFNSKVGIKDSAPDVLLHVNEGGEPPAEGMFILEANSASRQLRIQPPTNSDNGFIDYRGGNLTFLDDGTEVARFQGSTGFGIGTSTVNSKLEVAGNATITTADNSDNLTLKSTDADANAGPNLILQRDSGSPADGDAIGRIDFDADNDAGEVTSFFSIRAEIEDASDGTEDGQMKIDQMIAGTAVTALRFKSSETVFNDDSKDVDFRVEGNGDANLLFVDAGNDRIGVGTDSPAKLLSLKKDGGGGAIGIDIHNQGTDSADDALITFETQGHRNYSMGIDRSASSFVVMSEADGLGTARLTIDDSGDAIFSGTVGVPALDIMSGSSIHGTITTSSSSLTLNARNTGIMIFQSGGTERMRIGSDGATTITTTGNEDTLTLKSTDTDANVGPNLRLYRAVTGAASDAIGTIDWAAQDAGGGLTDYASAAVTITDATDGSEDATLTLKVMNAGALNQMLTISGPETVVNEGSKDHDFRVESDGNTHKFMVNGGNNLVGINADPDLGSALHIKNADSGGSSNNDADELVLENSANTGISILSGTGSSGTISFGDSGAANRGLLTYDHSADSMKFGCNGAVQARITNGGTISLNESAPDAPSNGLTMNTGSNDGNVLTMKSSDVAHGMTAIAETDTFVEMLKNSDGGGALNLTTLSETATAFRHIACITGSNTAESTAATSAWGVDARKKNGTSVEGLAADDNLASFRHSDEAQVIFKGDGEIFSNQTATVGTYDAYEDAQLIRAYDLSHMKGVIDSKFDKFVQYNKDDLQKARLIGTDDDGKATPFVNITGMSRLHNGAIWQQYEKHQRLASAFYKLAEKTIGKEEADKLLTEEEIQLLN